MAMLLNKKIMITLAFATIILGVGYYFTVQATEAAAQGGAGDAPAMPVSVEIIQPEAVQIWKEFPARLEAVEYAEIRPQVSGVITEIKFEDGAEVQKGDVLYVIDTRPYQAEVSRAQADLNLAYNQTELAQKELTRAQNLIEVDAISKRLYDERASAVKVSQAKAASAKAQLEQAKINLDYANVKAPITGKVGRAEVKIGNLVQAGLSGPLLTSIVSSNGIYADFEIDDQTYLNEINRTSAGDSEASKVPVILALKSDNNYEGFVKSFDNHIDSNSGTIRARAFFANEDKFLLPGMYATIEMGSASPKQQVIITEKAISTDQNRKFVYTVNDENKVTYRQVEIGESSNGKRVILSGLTAGDKVIVDGIIRLRPDMVVDPKTEEKQTESIPADETSNAPTTSSNATQDK